MTPHTKRKLIKRLYELADGGEHEIGVLTIWNALQNTEQLMHVLDIYTLSQHERRVLAGFAAAYLETET
jgi:hypothetical protein